MAGLCFKILFPPPIGCDAIAARARINTECEGLKQEFMRYSIYVEKFNIIHGTENVSNCSEVCETLVSVEALFKDNLVRKFPYDTLCRDWDVITSRYYKVEYVPFLVLHHKSAFEHTRSSQHGDISYSHARFGTMPFSGSFVHYLELPKGIVHFRHDTYSIELNWSEMHKSYRMTASYNFIRKIIFHKTGGSAKLYFDLLHPPVLFHQEDKRTRYGKKYEILRRVLETPQVKASVFGKANVLQLELDYDTVSKLIPHLHFRCRRMDILYGNVLDSFNYPPSDPKVEFGHFPCNYLMSAILKRNFFLAEQLRNPMTCLNFSYYRLPKMDILEKTLISILFLIDSGKFIIVSQALSSLYSSYESKKTEEMIMQYIIPENSRFIRRVTITPTRILFYAPETMFENRVLRNFDSEFALRVNFRDDNMTRLSFVAAYAEDEIFTKCIKDPMLNDILIDNRCYKFLAWSNSQIRDHGVWMYARDSKGSTAFDIRSWMGDFSHIKSVSKYMARMGQSFSQTVDTVSVPLSGNHVRFEDDIESGYDEMTQKKYCFSDGVGRISTSLAKKVHDVLRHDKLCSAFQIRYGGCKGMLVIDPTLIDVDIVFRKSMKKFDSPKNTRLEIAKTSAPCSLQLNRPFITILDQMGIPAKIFLQLQYKMLHTLTDMLLNEDEAAKYLTSHTPSKIFEFNELCGSGLTTEPFFRSLLLALHRDQVDKLKSRANIAIDPDDGRNMLGVLDETRCLEYGEVFVQYTVDMSNGETTRDTTIVKGTVLVTKNPCLLPGDVRKFQAVDVPALHHIVDCIVFPQKGQRPHPNEMAGSDLDGDEYAVIWNKDLIFNKSNHAAGSFPSTSGPEKTYIEVKDMVEFLQNYIKNDQVGVIASAHLAHADYSNIFSHRCIEIAKKFSIAVDYAKNGSLQQLQQTERPNQYPDFMERSYKLTYKSEKVLGKIYRICKDFETENKNASHKYNCIQVDPAFKYPGWENYKFEAKKTRDKYNFLLSTIFQNYGVSHEAEAFSGAFSRLHCRFQERKDKAEVEKVIIGSIKALCKNIKKEFLAEFKDNAKVITETAFQKASAWYVVTYEDEMSEFLSFPWIVSGILANIYRMNKGEFVVPFYTPIVKKIDTMIQETANANLLTLLPHAASFELNNYTFLCDSKIVERALRVMIHWAVDVYILHDFDSTKMRGFMYMSTFIKLFFHVASLEGYVCQKSFVDNKAIPKPKTDGNEKEKSSAALCLAFFCFSISLRFCNKKDVKQVVPFDVYRYKDLSRFAMSSYHNLAINGRFDAICFDTKFEARCDMRTELIESSVFPQVPVSSEQLEKAAQLLEQSSGAEVNLRESTLIQKVLVSANGTEESLHRLKALIRKDQETLRSFFSKLGTNNRLFFDQLIF